jgi:predicted RNase H-related nuclease YkuK (DUF458 family)
VETIAFNDDMISEIIDVLTDLSDETKIYFGCDSIRVRRDGIQYAKYATVLVIHKNGNNGCKIYKDISLERDYDQNASKPRMRLMNEVRKVAELYLQMYPYIFGYDIEVHLDVNPDELHGSSCVAKEATGYILGITGVAPKLKPDALAASFGADGIVHGFHERS